MQCTFRTLYEPKLSKFWSTGPWWGFRVFVKWFSKIVKVHCKGLDMKFTINYLISVNNKFIVYSGTILVNVSSGRTFYSHFWNSSEPPHLFWTVSQWSTLMRKGFTVLFCTVFECILANVEIVTIYFITRIIWSLHIEFWQSTVSQDTFKCLIWTPLT